MPIPLYRSHLNQSHRTHPTASTPLQPPHRTDPCTHMNTCGYVSRIHSPTERMQSRTDTFTSWSLHRQTTGWAMKRVPSESTGFMCPCYSRASHVGSRPVGSMASTARRPVAIHERGCHSREGLACMRTHCVHWLHCVCRRTFEQRILHH